MVANETMPIVMLRVISNLSSERVATRSRDRADRDGCAEHQHGEHQSADERESEALRIFETE